MRSEKNSTALIAAAIAFFLSFACIGCIVTGFDMTVNLWAVALWCFAGAAVSSVCFTLPLGPVPLSVTAITGGVLWVTGDLKLSFQAVIYRLSRKYNSVHGWTVFRPQHYTAEMLEQKLPLFLCFLGVLIAIGIAWAVCRRKTLLPGILLALFCVGSCFLVRETVPNGIFLWLMLFGVLLLLLTHTVRRSSADQGNRLTLIAAGPLAVFLLLLFIAVPQKDYHGDRLAQSVTNAILQNKLVQEAFGDMTANGNTGSSVDSGIVRLDSVGVRQLSQAEILQVDTTYTGRLYLRGRALDTYDGKTWTDSGQGTPLLYWPDENSLEPVGEVRIKTRFAHKMLYLPYYVQSMDLTDMTRGKENTKKLTDYSFTTARLVEENLSAAHSDTEISDPAKYLHLSDSVKKWAVPLAKEITAGKEGTYEKAQAIGNYVRTSARYDLKTKAMPYGKSDFAKWFLEDSETGYCVHFATAATVLLQAEGIPARYVTGYATDVQANCVSLVRAEDAHAWVEYWLPGFGWMILEVTPPAHSVPQEEIPAPAPETKTIDWQLLGIIGAGTLLAAIIGVFAQRTIRLTLRRKKLHSGTVKQRMLAYWQEAVRFAQCLEESPDENLLAIAEKAKFSPHTPVEADIARFEAYLQNARTRLKRHNIFRKLYYRFILALY